jgi:hypothetical protein
VALHLGGRVLGGECVLLRSLGWLTVGAAAGSHARVFSEHAHLALVHELGLRIAHMLAADEVEQQAQSIIVFDEVLKDFPLFHTVEVIEPHDHLAARWSPGGEVQVLDLLFLVPNRFGAPSEGLYKLDRVFRLLELLQQVLSNGLLAVVAHLFFRDFLLKLLDLVESSNQILLEVPLDVVGHGYHIVVCMVHLALVKLILYEGCQLLIVIHAEVCISGALTIGKWAAELCLIPEYAALL